MTQERDHILVVDDDIGGLRTLELVLGSVGYEVTTATNVRGALTLLDRVAPDLALVDLRLPDGLGTEVLAAARSRDPDLPVIMFTGHATVDTAIEALNEGAAAYVVKPLKLDELLAAARQHLEKRRLVLENRRLAQEVRQELEERRKAEAERTLLHAAVESAAEVMVVTDSAGYVRYANPAFEAVTGYSREDVLGGDLHVLDAEQVDPGVFESMRKALSEEGRWSGMLVSRKKDGTLFREEVTVSSVKRDNGAPDSFVYVRRDVTEKLRLEAVAQAINTMSNIGYVFSGIRHELGNPINATRMTLRMLRGSADQIDPAKLTRYLDRALEELGRVSYLLHSLKSFNMFEEVEVRPVEVRGFLRTFASLVGRDCERRGVALQVDGAVETDRGEPLELLGDPRALQQVLLNVLTNALDACEGVESARVALTVRKDCADVVIEVVDNGKGMTEEELDALFRPFVTTKQHGTGLGLVIARKMLSQMRGSIDVRSRKGEGTQVELRLPEADGEC